MRQAQDLHVAVELDEEVLLGDAHVGAKVARQVVVHRPPAEPAAVAAEVVEEDAQLAPVDDVEGNVVEVRRAHADDRHLMMLGMHVQPDTGFA